MFAFARWNHAKAQSATLTAQVTSLQAECARLHQETVEAKAESLKLKARVVWLGEELDKAQQQAAGTDEGDACAAVDVAAAGGLDGNGDSAACPPAQPSRPLGACASTLSCASTATLSPVVLPDDLTRLAEEDKVAALRALVAHNTALTRDCTVLANTLNMHVDIGRQQRAESARVVEELRAEIAKRIESQAKRKCTVDRPASTEEVLRHRLTLEEARCRSLEAKVDSLRSQRNEAREWIQKEYRRVKQQRALDNDNDDDDDVEDALNSLQSPPRLASVIPTDAQRQYATKLDALEDRVATLRKQRNQAYEQLDRRMRIERAGACGVTPVVSPADATVDGFITVESCDEEDVSPPAASAAVPPMHPAPKAPPRVPLLGVVEPSADNANAHRPAKVHRRLEKQKRKLEAKVETLCSEAYEQQQQLAVATLESEAQRVQLAELQATIAALRETVRELQTQRSSSAPPTPSSGPTSRVVSRNPSVATPLPSDVLGNDSERPDPIAPEEPSVTELDGLTAPAA